MGGLGNARAAAAAGGDRRRRSGGRGWGLGFERESVRQIWESRVLCFFFLRVLCRSQVETFI